LVDNFGVQTFIDEATKWGYTTFNNPNGYGPSIAVGGGDVKLIEHAQGYSVFANEGKYTQHETILKIQDRYGNIVYEYTPQPIQVADPRGIYIVNHILNGKTGGLGYSWDGRDIAGKTGTSEDQKETLFIGYTPEIVAAGWLGNNNNDGMRYGASGYSSARPWVSEFIQRVGANIPATPFVRPSGVVYRGGDLAINDIFVKSYVSYQTYLVCPDQPNRYARRADIAAGRFMRKSVVYYTMPNPKFQKYLDRWQSSRASVPYGYCSDLAPVLSTTEPVEPIEPPVEPIQP